MATQSVSKDVQGPLWPMGGIVSVTPGTPVQITSLVDAAKVNAPSSSGVGGLEYSPVCWSIIFVPGKPGVSHGVQANTGNIYILVHGVQGAGNRDDYGSMIMVLRPTDAPFVLTSSSTNRQTFSPYKLFIDADNAGDGAIVTLVIPG
jgi:hypothetical protein